MSIDLYTRFMLALVAVVALLGLFAWLARRLGLATRIAGPGGRRRLAIVEVTPVDGKRRLVLLRRDDVEHLVLLGPDGATVVESGIAPAPASFPAALQEAGS
jgi:flagellar protein FliO/FliZ